MSDDTKTVKTTKIAKIVDDYTVVINKGAKDGLKVGQRFIIYAYGDEIHDPDTNESLGMLEIVKGTGKISHLQDAIATLKSDMTEATSKSIRRIKRQSGMNFNLFGPTSEEIEEANPPLSIPFENPVVGDFVRQI